MSTKRVNFCGSSLRDLRDFPEIARKRSGQQLRRLQEGLMPEDFKSMKTVGDGAYEIRVSEDSGAFRVIYVAKFDEVIYVLHCFQKKSQQTSKEDIDLAKRRYRELLKEVRR